MNIKELRDKRRLARISGEELCLRAGLNRSRLSALERGVAQPREGELERFEKTLDRLIKAKQKIAAYAERAGYRNAIAS